MPADSNTMTDGQKTAHNIVLRARKRFKGKCKVHTKAKTSVSIVAREASCFCSRAVEVMSGCQVPDWVGNTLEDELRILRSTYSF